MCPHPIKSVVAAVATLSLLFAPALSRATNLVSQVSQGGGSMWEKSIWRTNQGVTTTFTMAAGNTYTLTSSATLFCKKHGNPRLRNNLTNANNIITFKGDSLMLMTNTDIRFKNITAGGGGTPLVCNFPG